MGPFEETNAALAPGEVANVQWTSPTTFTSDALGGAAQYHLYRG